MNNNGQAAKRSWVVPVLIGAIVLLAFLLIVEKTSQPEVNSSSDSTRSTELTPIRSGQPPFPPPPSNDSDKLDSVAELLGGLRARLEDQPDDMQGWVLLAKSYAHLGQSAEADQAWSKAREYGYSGEQTSSTTTAAPARANPHTARADNTGLFEQIRETTNAPANAKPTLIRVRLEIDKESLAQRDPDDTVFVYAIAEKGSRAPLAIARKSIAELPLTVELDDAMSMIPAHKLSSASQVKIVARVSNSGQSTPQAGDLQVTSKALATGAQHELKLLLTAADKILK